MGTPNRMMIVRQTTSIAAFAVAAIATASFAAAPPPGETTLSNPGIAYTVPEVGHVTLTRDEVTIVVADNQGNLIANAYVEGFFSGTFTDEFNEGQGPSLADGSVTFDTAGTSKGKITLEFCVTYIAAPVGSDLADFDPPIGECPTP